MSENERKRVHELTNEELQREIADRLGYKFNTPGVRHDLVLSPTGDRVELPNWPADTAAAFKLAHQCKPEGSIVRVDYFGDAAVVMYFASDVPMPYRPAPLPRALSELARLALAQTSNEENKGHE